ncbi:hypothetical protein NMY22_g1207 [Coprinellus aureogranulatus]|nr:hypothetical protein NMY22_g1207 [Coprinellus aureogranulatus]
MCWELVTDRYRESYESCTMIITSASPGLPPLPLLESHRGDDVSDLQLDVRSHISTHIPYAELKPGYGNVKRLLQLGAHTFRSAATQFYFSQQPMLRDDLLAVRIISSPSPVKQRGVCPMQKGQSEPKPLDGVLGNQWMKIQEATTGTKIHEYLDAYGLKPKLVVPPEVRRQDIWADNGEMEQYFYTYVGAACYLHGSTAISTWANALFNITEGIKPEEDEDATMAPPGYPAPPPPAGLPPQYANPPAPAGQGSAAPAAGGSSFNKANIEYTQTPTGPPHNPVWTVRCLVNGQEMGSATAAKTKTAKEEAARKAFVAMGWSPRN